MASVAFDRYDDNRTFPGFDEVRALWEKRDPKFLKAVDLFTELAARDHQKGKRARTLIESLLR